MSNARPNDDRAPDSPNDGLLMTALGAITAFALAAVTVPVRDDVGVTNIALGLALVVVVASLASRTAGITTAVVAAVAFNFFHTQPYRSLRISDGRDIATVVLLVVTGLVVSEISARGRSTQRSNQRHRRAEGVLETTSAMLASGAPIDELWGTIDNGLRTVVHLEDCRYVEGPDTSLPLISRVGSIPGTSRTWTGGGFELPDGGAALAVTYRGTTLGHIVLTGRKNAGSVLDERRAAVALADQMAIGIALGRDPST